MANSTDGAGFQIHKISLSGAAGAVVAIGAIAILVFGVPSLRWALLFAIVGGGIFGAALRLVPSSVEEVLVRRRVRLSSRTV